MQSFSSKGGNWDGTGFVGARALGYAELPHPKPGDCKANCEQPLLFICFFVFCASPGVQSLLFIVAMAEHSPALCSVLYSSIE